MSRNKTSWKDLEVQFECWAKDLPEGRVELECKIRVPKPEPYYSGSTIPHQIFVTFRPIDSSSVADSVAGQRWIPEKIERYLDNGTGEMMWWRVECEDFQNFAGTWVPRRSIQWMVANRTDTGDLAEQIDYTEFEQVPLEEVTKRCDLSYWQLANLDVGKSTLRWWVVGGTIALALAGWWFRSRYQPAR